MKKNLGINKIFEYIYNLVTMWSQGKEVRYIRLVVTTATLSKKLENMMKGQLL